MATLRDKILDFEYKYFITGDSDTHDRTTEKEQENTDTRISESVVTPVAEFIFQPNVKYSVAFGNFEEGVVLDINSMDNVHEFVFTENEFSKTLTDTPHDF